MFQKNPKTVVILFIYLFLGWILGTFPMWTMPRKKLTKMKVKSFSAWRENSLIVFIVSQITLIMIIND